MSDIADFRFTRQGLTPGVTAYVDGRRPGYCNPIVISVDMPPDSGGALPDGFVWFDPEIGNLSRQISRGESANLTLVVSVRR